VGAWTQAHGSAIYGGEPADGALPPDCRLTRAGNRLFVNVFAWPAGHLAVDGLAGKVSFASFLHDGSEVKFTAGGAGVAGASAGAGAQDAIVLQLPIRRPDVLTPVVELVLAE
jgi:alpha-L-fucosidase